jgi:hypothetical protein
MTMRVATVLCALTVVLAVTATVFSLINAGGFDWKPIGKGLTLITIAFVAWSSARARVKPAPPPAEQPPKM